MNPFAMAVKELENRIAQTTDVIVSGNLSLEEYHSSCGEVSGLRRAITEIRRIESIYSENDE